MNSTDTTQIIRGSLLGKIGISIRGAIVMVLVFTVCVLASLKVEVSKELYWLTSAAVTYYFGQNHGSEKP